MKISTLGAQVVISAITATILLSTATHQEATAQYFGKNKARYETFDFKVEQSPHFEIYHYFSSDSIGKKLAAQSEKWYSIHQQIFKDTFDTRNPVIFYANHADFQQTTAISGSIGIGTGGVTESLKNRVILPVSESYSQTNHVLGHEMVHAFQYHMLLHNDDDTVLTDPSLRNLPLWMVEGLAEYMSIGSNDAHTALWLRDALLTNDIPTLKDMTRKPAEYFPYRFGHAFWAFATGLKGDSIITPLFKYTANYGYEKAIDSLFNMSAESFSGLWKSAIQTSYSAYKQKKDTLPAGRKLLRENNAGQMVLSPSLSPNGRYVAFLSNRNIFSLDLFIADVKTGNILAQLTSRTRNTHIDAISFIESSGTWSPRGNRFAYVVVSKGKNKLMINEVQRRVRDREIEIPGVPAFSNPSWSPDGRYILVSGLVQGQTDLYLYDLQSNKTIQLTDDPLAELQPDWSPDGKRIAYVVEQNIEGQPESRRNYHYQVAIMNVENETSRVINIFPGANNVNPMFSSDGSSLYFLSDRDGFRNLYMYEFKTEKTYRRTNFFTGITGITFLSPAASIAGTNDQIVYSYYSDDKYEIYSVKADALPKKEVSSRAVNKDAAQLPPGKKMGRNIVDNSLAQQEDFLILLRDSIRQVRYQPKFKLDYISSSTQVGVATGGYQTTGLAGGVNAWFSDILGRHQLYTGLALNGEIYDVAGQVAFINQKKPIHWGASVSHIPARYSNAFLKPDTLFPNQDTVPVTNLVLDNLRQFQDEISLFAYYPLSKSNRIEAGTSLAWYYYRFDRINNYYYSGVKVDESKERLPSPDGFFVQHVNAAYVSDNSAFGVTSPMAGRRYRLQLSQYFGELTMTSVLADYRRYFFMKPLTFAFRLLHQARYGEGRRSNLLSPLSIAYPTLIRGYEIGSFYRYQSLEEGQEGINQLFGTRILVGNVELRFPFTGPEQLSLIKSGIFFTDWALFFDSGIAWNKGQFPVMERNEQINNNERSPLTSVGLSLRINLFGYLVFEPYYAFPLTPLNRQGMNAGVFGVNIAPGW